MKYPEDVNWIIDQTMRHVKALGFNPDTLFAEQIRWCIRRSLHLLWSKQGEGCHWEPGTPAIKFWSSMKKHMWKRLAILSKSHVEMVMEDSVVVVLLVIVVG